MDEGQHLAVNSPDERSIVISKSDFLLCQGMIFVLMVHSSIIVKHATERAHRNQEVDPVAMVDIECRKHLVHGMIGIKVPVTVYGMLEPPRFFVWRKLNETEIVYVACF